MATLNTKKAARKGDSSKGNRSPKDQKSIRTLLNDNTAYPQVVETAARKLFEDVNTPTSLGLAIALRYSDYESLCTHTVRPLDYLKAADYAVDNQCCKLLSKYKGFRNEDHPACIAAAKATFEDGERQCQATNEILRARRVESLCLVPELDRLLPLMAEKISEILGSFDTEEWLDCCRFGPGAAVGSAGTSDYIKLSRAPAVTPEFVVLARGMLRAYPRWGELWGESLKVVPGGKYSQVPKNFKTNRNIETQPLLNGFAQLGLGLMMRKRLKKAGIDLDSQDRNKYFAYLGALNGTFGTLDLSNASDTIALELCRVLLPPQWLHALEVCRTSRIKIHKEIRTLERFSSMGNGYTFELETLIFYALSLVACEKDVGTKSICVYGDDIIVPVEHFDNVVRCLNLCGFTPNVAKSFKTGPFRESCGADWFWNHPVRPFYIKEVPTNVASLIALANGLKRASRWSDRGFCYDRRYYRAWSDCLRRVPKFIRDRVAWTDGSDRLVTFRKIPGIPVKFLQLVNPWVDDTVIFSSIRRDGLCLQFKGRKRAVTSLAIASLTALYRLHSRQKDKVDDYAEHWRVPQPGERRKSVMTYVERRDEGSGVWQLATYRIDSLIRHDQELWL